VLVVTYPLRHVTVLALVDVLIWLLTSVSESSGSATIRLPALESGENPDVRARVLASML
jgi:hypothetical protein